MTRRTRVNTTAHYFCFFKILTNGLFGLVATVEQGEPMGICFVVHVVYMILAQSFGVLFIFSRAREREEKQVYPMNSNTSIPVLFINNASAPIIRHLIIFLLLNSK